MTKKILDAPEVAKHNSPDSCWVVLYGKVYDVTEFLPHHPGGAQIILQLAGKDATEEYDPIHPSGTLEENLKPEACLGTIDPEALSKAVSQTESNTKAERTRNEAPAMSSLLNLDDIEEAATKQISKKAWAYYFSAADDLISKSLNNTIYRSILLRPRVFVDCTNCDLTTIALGHKLGLPIYVCPAAMARLAHPVGEAGIAAACSKFGAMQLISNNASMTPEEIVQNATSDQVFGWQIYVQTQRKKSEAMLARINKLKSIKFVCLTLDAPVPAKREHDERTRAVAQATSVFNLLRESGGTPIEGGAGIGQQLFAGTDPSLTWSTTLPWLAQHTNLPIVLKGIQTHEDAYIASLHAPQVKAIILSNHGGRSMDTAPPAVHTLLEIRKFCPEVFDRLEVWVDGGIKRGTDVVKALCLGARCVGIGRAPLFGLGAGGVEGVERVLEILSTETKTAMRLLGVDKVEDLGMQHINARAVEQQIYDGPAGLHALDLLVKPKL
ncbi:L-lactate dehydrogenase (cytochrome), variant 2 [Blastomyces dermatitidis ER-3]|uniref:L-lactate dehydrogenase (Cytochrome) n=1 Tax=Ajellomyces dermatitidis (strain ER-3 / ATCC MYA-2586) TaxID=559297 RepID=A0ABX2VWW2_AJEDR|nr:L-lactate dehydrogenase (cytochrome) [Blastomyces dermatitidis ER-3]XP_045281371.1 L-lactate dehydrogenase (cytochrome), variant 1 [Blastomyces dermatitidis ER-3]XP_045281372.1 L-lactate dehydrogenase (cytochrome), variant 2 [Blastomyces dermatitidis ER-3]EEQ90602.1 L-lactate dehydrogenase (cytochrome) [Blastomyces dermatitidis ER-3]OAT01644.1 L-lactate dehydrogenase (cytochrome), variant 1 [Blastomyces dermatitidis ER-3]OAT01645.1 L-lactate dehydrogenase (cytochrome), variant 2 [Blastomyce